MNEPFILPVVFGGTNYEFKARFERWGYTHRIAVLIGEETFVFEPDEEGSYRALGNCVPGNIHLLQTVAVKLAGLSK
jgi:hypothetical protein